MKKSLRTSLLVGLLTLVGVSQVWAGTATEPTVSFTHNEYKGYQPNTDQEYTNYSDLTLTTNSDWVKHGEFWAIDQMLSGDYQTCIQHKNPSTNAGEMIDWFTMAYTVPAYSSAEFTTNYQVKVRKYTTNEYSSLRAAYFDYGTDANGYWAGRNKNANGDTNFKTSGGILSEDGSTRTYGYKTFQGESIAAWVFAYEGTDNNVSKTVNIDNSTGTASKTENRYGALSSSKSKNVANPSYLDNYTKLNIKFSVTTSYYKYVTFNANEGTGTAMAKQVIKNSGNLTANTYTRDGYTFIGWNTAANGSGTAYTDGQAITATSSDKGEITLYAQWSFDGQKATEITSSYTPTQIVNGNFDEEPWMTFTYQGTTYTSCPNIKINQSANDAPVSNVVFNGVNGGWNTTELNVWNSNLFEYTFRTSGTHSIRHNSSIPQSDKYIEMNCLHSCMLYQDLTTKGGDIIRWTLDHAVTQPCCGINPVQPMRVEIGAPNRDGSGNIVNASGWADNLNTQMVANTVAKYRYDGVTNPSGKTYGYGNTSELQYLRLTRANNDNGWWNCKGVYVVPEGQTVTRFGFISEAETPDVGNLLDNITFSTLLGNLKAVANADGSATITGYWGDSDNTKRLMIKIGDEDAIPTDMSSVINKNFSIDVPAATIGEAASITVYHQDYPDASKTVAIFQTKATEVTSSYTPTKIVNGNFDVEPWMTYTYQGTTYTSCPHIDINQSAGDAPVSNVVFNGVNGGWNTTDLNVWESNLFEYTFRTSGTHSHQHNGSISQTVKYIEMNCLHSCMLYQDLTTKGGDIIRWTLDHAVTLPGDEVQPMRVEIGAPNRDGSGNIVNASGWADNLKTQMVANTVAQYRYDGVTNPSGVTYGYGNTSEMQYLRLTITNNSNGWWNCKGVYVVPEGQTVTRFGFISEAEMPNSGNLLDNITFSTLLGNLKAVANADGSATVTGYWGDSDNTKRLMIKIGDEDAIPTDMSSVINKNFSIDVPAATIGDATSFTVYHQDYPDASKTVAILKTITDGTGMSFSDAESFINDKLTSWQGACAGSKTISLIIERNIYKDGYFNTLCLPFDATADQIAATFGEAPKELKKYLSCTVQGEGDDREIIIDTKDTTGIKAGEAYLISFENGTTLTSLTFQNVQVTITEPIAQTGELYYQGVLAPVVMEYDNQNLLFVGEQNRLYWPKNDGTFLKGFRAYFKVTGGTVQGAPVRNGMKASFGTGKTVATGVNNLSTNNEVRKLIQQGRVVIRTNGVMYDMNGNIVK